MLVKQISVFVENRIGRLAELTKTLADNNINLVAITVADTIDFGILRCIVDKPDEAVSVLKNGGFTASVTKVLAVEMDDKPGGLATVLEVLVNEGLNVEYVYSFVRSRKGHALVLFRVADPEKAMSVLQEKGISLLCLDDIIKCDWE